MTKPMPSVPLLIFIRDTIGASPPHHFMIKFTADNTVGYAQKLRYMATTYPLARRELDTKIKECLMTIATANLHGVLYSPTYYFVRLICIAMLRR